MKYLRIGAVAYLNYSTDIRMLLGELRDGYSRPAVKYLVQGTRSMERYEQ
jgi:hypothetical protein